MIHIVFNEIDVEHLKVAFANDEMLAGEVLQIKDDYAVGPLANLSAADGREERLAWWQEVTSGTAAAEKVAAGEIDDYKTAAEIAEKLRENEKEEVWIWVAQNQHDLSGYYWLLVHLREFQGRVMILHLNNLPFINNDGGVFYPEWLNEIPGKEFAKAKKLSRPVTVSEFELDTEEWEKLSERGSMVRGLEGAKKLSLHDEGFYDNELKKFIGKDYKKASRVLRDFYSKSKVKTGDVFLQWRIKKMIAAGILETPGEIKDQKDFDIRIKQEGGDGESN